ncbi:EF-hand domain-containing protein [Saccharothrix texasensis]|uniref:Ca2+-binding EF-hand superfamily protein n=1 Tax=Saccharothrix texasensis TaxID=103734 RepID=A0A3N1HHK3_9PSEU|nr:EF-hand domain-containing protein [Saccharothrix texasensis]ROP41980.1 Ca2+-binding EF-hand superfamily protein [Saccharothrix texasensis]
MNHPQAALSRVDLVFTLFDANGSGEIEANDFEVMAHRVVEAAPQSDAAAKEAMTAAFHRYWKTLAEELDDDRNGRIDREEFEDSVLSPERFDSTIDEFARSLAALSDPDGDGLIERPVFTALMSAIGFERQNIDALFAALEPDQDDRISVSDWVDSIKDFYRPDAAGIPGDHLVPSAG